MSNTMREILFRGKRVDNDEWVTGYYIRIVRKTSTKEIIRHCIFTGVEFWDNLSGETALESYEVNPSTLGQYTGLTDKNGNKIFEGDILQRKINVYRLGEREPSGERMLTGIVVWETHPHCTGSWELSAYDEFGNKANYSFDDSFKVINNIHDNPELLEESNA